MAKKRIGIGDIAKQLNVSITTVSFIINGKAEEKRISQKLTKKVMNLVNELNYVPNQLAKSLRTGKTHIIGLIVEDISNPFFACVARLIEEKANKKGYKIIYCSSDNDAVKTSELIKVFRERQVDGYIITPSIGIEEDINSLIENHLPTILFDRRLPDMNTNYVGTDNEGGTYKAIKHLIKQGYKNIAFVTINSEQPQMIERLNGYLKAISENSLHQFIKNIDYGDDDEVKVQKLVSFFSKRKKFDAVFFATNYLGIRGLDALKKLEMRIPDDIAVISFDDHDLFRLYSPSVTVVAQPIEEMARKIIEILFDNIEGIGKKEKSQNIVLPTSFIIRDSTSVKN
jgi:LacI family transcriptional regulator